MSGLGLGVTKIAGLETVRNMQASHLSSFANISAANVQHCVLQLRVDFESRTLTGHAKVGTNHSPPVIEMPVLHCRVCQPTASGK